MSQGDLTGARVQTKRRNGVNIPGTVTGSEVRQRLRRSGEARLDGIGVVVALDVMLDEVVHCIQVIRDFPVRDPIKQELTETWTVQKRAAR